MPETDEAYVQRFRQYGRYPDAGYGGMFARWLRSDAPRPYNSFGNGSAMRVSPVGFGAQAAAAAIYIARTGGGKAEDFEDAIRKAVSLGGVSDTLACIAGGVAQDLMPPDTLQR